MLWDCLIGTTTISLHKHSLKRVLFSFSFCFTLCVWEQTRVFNVFLFHCIVIKFCLQDISQSNQIIINVYIYFLQYLKRMKWKDVAGRREPRLPQKVFERQIYSTSQHHSFFSFLVNWIKLVNKTQNKRRTESENDPTTWKGEGKSFKRQFYLSYKFPRVAALDRWNASRWCNCIKPPRRNLLERC